MYEFLNLDEPIHPNKKSGNSTVIVIVAIVLIVGALAWWGIMNTEDEATLEALEDIENQEDQQYTQPPSSNNTNDLLTERNNARAELLILQAQLEAKENQEEALRALEELESDLERKYANADAEAKAEWAELKVEFDRLETAIRDESADMMQILAGIILRLEGDIRTDENDEEE